VPSLSAAIDEGSVKTWSYGLILNVIPPSKGVSTEAYAVYHGRFIEMLLAHFEQDFSDASATAMPDRVK
jgi:hypothetical protein